MPPACINCGEPLPQVSQRHWLGHDLKIGVGPFCVSCHTATLAPRQPCPKCGDTTTDRTTKCGMCGWTWDLPMRPEPREEPPHGTQHVPETSQATTGQDGHEAAPSTHGGTHGQRSSQTTGRDAEGVEAANKVDAAVRPASAPGAPVLGPEGPFVDRADEQQYLFHLEGAVLDRLTVAATAPQNPLVNDTVIVRRDDLRLLVGALGPEQEKKS